MILFSPYLNYNQIQTERFDNQQRKMWVNIRIPLKHQLTLYIYIYISVIARIYLYSYYLNPNWSTFFVYLAIKCWNIHPLFALVCLLLMWRGRYRRRAHHSFYNMFWLTILSSWFYICYYRDFIILAVYLTLYEWSILKVGEKICSYLY